MNHSHVVNMDFIEFYGSYPDVYLSPADQQGNRIIKMINYSDLHKRIKRSRWGPACTCVPIYIYTATAFLFFNLVVQLYSAAITEFVQGPRYKKMSAKLQPSNNICPYYIYVLAAFNVMCLHLDTLTLHCFLCTYTQKIC